MAAGGEKRSRARRDYRPTVEGLEALRLLSAAQAHLLPGMVAERDLLADPSPEPQAAGQDAHHSPVSSAAWDAALGHTRLADFLSGTEGPPTATSSWAIATATQPADPALIHSGLTQLNKYLNRAWYRAGSRL